MSSSCLREPEAISGRSQPVRRLVAALAALWLAGAAMAANTPPVATPQTVAVTMNVPVPVTLAATDAEGDALTYVIVSAPFRGVLGGIPPNLTYTPSANFTGNDNFWFVAKDAAATSAHAASCVLSILRPHASVRITVGSRGPSASVSRGESVRSADIHDA
jgi:hypothetical protein